MGVSVMLVNVMSSAFGADVWVVVCVLVLMDGLPDSVVGFASLVFPGLPATSDTELTVRLCRGLEVVIVADI